MAQCKLCDQSGWFLRTSENGLCASCESIWDASVSSHSRVIQESIKIATTTKKLDVMLSRLKVAIDATHQLRCYEERGIPTLESPPSETIHTIQSGRQTIVLEWIGKELANARSKSQAATTPAGKTRPYSKLLEHFNMIYAELDDTADIKEAETKIRQEMDGVRLRMEIERAQKLAFKGQKKRACEAYLDALFLLRTDATPDDQQRDTAAKIEAAIKELGGDIPLAAE